MVTRSIIAGNLSSKGQCSYLWQWIVQTGWSIGIVVATDQMAIHPDPSRGRMEKVTIEFDCGAKKPGPKPLPEGVKKHRVNICLSLHWHEAGKEKAAARRLSFSEYLISCPSNKNNK